MKWNEKINLEEHNIYFASDPHLWHTNVLLHDNRPFKDVAEMYHYFVDSWNSKVTDNDYGFIAGDICWSSRKKDLDRLANDLNGKVCIILGNHDKEKSGNFSSFYSVARTDFIRAVNKSKNIDQGIFISHYPCISWASKGRGIIHLHGHTHGSLDDYNEKSVDLRVDISWPGKLANYNILSFDDIYNYFLNKTKGVNFINYMNNIYNNKLTII